MNSDVRPPREAFVWIGLPGETELVVAGRIRAEGRRFVFNYGRSYLDRHEAIPIHEPELALRPGIIQPEPPLELATARDCGHGSAGIRKRRGASLMDRRAAPTHSVCTRRLGSGE